jgi:hypothetical protein
VPTAIKYTGQDLKDFQWLLKVRDDNVGFLTKLTLKGELPKPFDEWGCNYYTGNKLDIEVKVIDEEFSADWKLPVGDSYKMYRLGKSQSWVKVIHPLGFVLEVRIQNFFEKIVPFLSDGKLTGKYKWIGNELERQ